MSWDRGVLVDFVGIHDGDCRTVDEWVVLCEDGLLGHSAMEAEGVKVVGVAVWHLGGWSSICSRLQCVSLKLRLQI